MINIYVQYVGRMRAAQRHISIYTHTFCSHPQVPPPFFQPGSSTPPFFKNNNQTHNSDVKKNRHPAPRSTVETQQQACGETLLLKCCHL